MEYVSFILRSSLALLFLLAAAGKATNIAGFSRTLEAIAVPGRLIKPVTAALIAAELVAGISLLVLTGRLAFVAVVLASLLLILFGAVSIRALGRAEEIPCSCFGRTQ